MIALNEEPHGGLISLLRTVAVLATARGLDAILESLHRRNNVCQQDPYF